VEDTLKRTERDLNLPNLVIFWDSFCVYLGKHIDDEAFDRSQRDKTKVELIPELEIGWLNGWIERAALICSVTKFVCKSVCKACVSWKKLGLIL